MSSSEIEELGSLRGEVEEIARGARQTPPDSAEDAAAMSYSFGKVGGIVSSAEEKVAAILETIKETLAKLAPVASFETTTGGFTARTVINYSCFAASVWSSGTTTELVDAHLNSLKKAYAFRAAATTVVAAVGNAVAAISIAVGNPLTAWHAVKSADALKVAVERFATAVAANAQSVSQNA